MKLTVAPSSSWILPAQLKKVKRFVSIEASASNEFSNGSRPLVHKNASTDMAFFQPERSVSAYVHLPFCRKRCLYCDFPIVALGSASRTDADHRIESYVELIRREIDSIKPSRYPPQPLETVFFGGGTPSLVSPRMVSSILETLQRKFGLSETAEISMEMDPGTFDSKKLRDFIGLGINRVSLGVQAFQEELLRACGRAHGLNEVYEAIDIVGSCGVENWSLDLISSLPHQTTEMWEESLRITAEHAQPKHVSVYDLQVEQGTKFEILYTPGEFPLPSESQSADFYKMASSILSGANYNHYEISSYCKDGFECKHNYSYWSMKQFYGFGLGAASYLNGVRFSRPRKMKDYTLYVASLESEEDEGDDQAANVESKDLAMELVMLSLRTSRGLDVRSFRKQFGDSLVYSILNLYKPFVESGHVMFLDQDRIAMSPDDLTELEEGSMGSDLAFLRLSDPDGFLLSNELISRVFEILSP